MADNAPPFQNVDEGGEIVLNRFYDFLAKFTSSAEGTTDGTDGVQLYRDYLAQIAAMVENEKNTVYVDVQHVFSVREKVARACRAQHCVWLVGRHTGSFFALFREFGGGRAHTRGDAVCIQNAYAVAAPVM